MEAEPYVDVFGFKLPVTAVERVCRGLKDHAYRDRNSVSAALELSNKNVQGWYGCISKEVSPLIESGIRERKPADIGSLTNFINKGDCRAATIKTKVMLRNMSIRIKDKRLKLENVDPEKLDAVVNDLDAFCEKVAEKKNWLNTKIYEKKDVETSVLNRWLNDLQQIQDQIVEKTEDLNQRLGNDPLSVRMFLTNLIRI